MKMDKISLLIFLGIAVSCNRDFTCECIQTETIDGVPIDTVQITTDVLGVSKRTVKNAAECISYETTIVDENGNVSSKTVDCTISKK